MHQFQQDNMDPRNSDTANLKYDLYTIQAH